MNINIGFYVLLICFLIETIFIIVLISMVRYLANKLNKVTKAGINIEAKANIIKKYECQHCNNISSFKNKELPSYKDKYTCSYCNKQTKFSEPLTEEYINNRPKTAIVGHSKIGQPIYNRICKHCETMNLVDHVAVDSCYRCRATLPVVVK